MRRLTRWLCALAFCWGAFGALAQEPLSSGVIQSPVLTVDSEQLFNGSQYGQAVIREIEEASVELQTENDRIASELEAEERLLTERRAEMQPADFKVLADAFDAKAQRIRGERAAASRALTQKLEQERLALLNAAIPILQEIMREAGAAVVLEQRGVFISALAVDITDLAIQRIDANLTRP